MRRRADSAVRFGAAYPPAPFIKLSWKDIRALVIRAGKGSLAPPPGAGLRNTNASR